jgi:hypothetical protein
MAAVIGNARHAKQIHDFYMSGGRDRDLDQSVWKPIGSGGQRRAYLHIPTNVVYKIQYTDSWESMGYCSESELFNARKLRAKVRKNDGWWGAYVRIPKVSGFRVRIPSGEKALVIGMEYVEGKSGYDGYSREAGRELSETRIPDLHYKNVIVDKDGSVWPIDMGGPMHWD